MTYKQLSELLASKLSNEELSALIIIMDSDANNDFLESLIKIARRRDIDFLSCSLSEYFNRDKKRRK